MPPVTPLDIVCRDGLNLHGMRYATESSGPSEHRILCLHGWMDNINSFWRLAPALVQGLDSPAELVTVDLPGHGKSSHKSLDGPTMLLMDYVYYVHEILMFLEWKPEEVTLIGHSMGGSLCMMYAAAFPTCHLILLDSLGPHVKNGGAGEHLRTHIKARLRGKDPGSIYESLEQAVDIRMLSAKTFPGNQYISRETAQQLVEGAITKLDDERVQFLHDQRLKMPHILYLSQAQVDEFYKAVADSSTRTCVLLAEQGMPFPPEMTDHTSAIMQTDTLKKLPGSHHFHADPDSSDAVVKGIVSFIEA
jgi:pimeloyl-ACP methyl ester carboxylesterase